MPNFGFSESAVKWFENYLTGRSQKTVANNVYSNCLNWYHNWYADDTVLYLEGNSQEELTRIIQEDLNILVKYCDKNQLTINASKTKAMVYTYESNIKLGRLEIKGNEVEMVHSDKY